MNRSIFENKYKAILTSCLVFVFCTIKSQNITVYDFENNPIEEIVGVYENIYLVGASDTNGNLNYSSDYEGKKVVLQKLGYYDTIVTISEGKVYQLRAQKFKIPLVEIVKEKTNPKEILTDFVNFNIPLMNSRMDTINMDFTYELYLPSIDQSEIRSGRLMLIYNSYDKKATRVWRSNYCEVKVSVDSQFWHSPIKKEFIEGTIIGSFEKDGMRSKRLLRKNRYKNHDVIRSVTKQAFQFKLTSDKNRRLAYTKVGFNIDSTISYYTYQWLNDVDDLKKTGIKNTKINSQYSYLKYSEAKPLTVDSIYSKVGFTSKSGVLHEYTFNANRSSRDDFSSCLEISIFLKFNPKVFNRMGIEEKVEYQK